MKKEIKTERAPKAVGPYSQAILVGNTLYISGQIPLDPETGALVEGDIVACTKRVMDSIKVILEEAGMTMDNVVKTTCLLTDLGNFAAMNEVYASYFGEVAPARACFEVKALPKGAIVEIEAIAVKD